MTFVRTGLALAMAAMMGLAGCGTTSGAVIGGATGYALGGNVASTAAGAIAGGVIGHQRERR